MASDETKPSIIAADDDPATLMMFKRILEKRYDVRACRNGSEVLAEFAMRPAQLVILDNSMPEMDGQETVTALRQSPTSWNVPILIVSARNQEEDIVRGISGGADDYITKPVTPPELLAKVEVALRKSEMAVPGFSLQPGALFNGRYRLDRVLGEGGYSKVFAARDMEVSLPADPWVAIKFFDLPGFATREGAMATFLREAYEHSRLDHPNIVRLTDFGHISNYYFLVMEYLDGATLADRIEAADGAPLADEELLSVAAQAADALNYMDRQNVVHRDIKPSNIMICADGRVKLMDFGLAKNPEEATVNLEDTFRGTPHFSSPEHILSDMDIDIRADIYSLGATLYTAATGRHPFEDSSSVAVLRMHLNETAERVGDVNPGLDPALAGLIDQCLERDRDKRPTVSELALKLDVLAAE